MTTQTSTALTLAFIRADMWWLNLTVSVILLLSLSTAQDGWVQETDNEDLNNRAITDSCRTPRDEVGTCQPLSKCTSLLRLMQTQRPLSQSTIQFLRKSQCGFAITEPKVCCAIPPAPTTAKPPVTTAPEVTTTQAPVTSEKVHLNKGALPDTNECGLSTNERIFGGEVTNIDEFPWMALIEYQKPNGHGFYCGGVLISKRYVLTAAHCVKGKDLPKTWKLTSVRLGEFDTQTEQDCVNAGSNTKVCADPVQDVPVEEQIVHGSYGPSNRNQQHDIALLRLSRDVTFTDFIRPICIPTTPSQKTSLWVAGWGRTENRSESNVKLKLLVPLVEHSKCSPVYTKAGVKLEPTQVCAGGQKGRDSCRGDSGGPLMAEESKPDGTFNWYITGIVSFGPSPCGMEGWPGVYTKVFEYVDWIVENVKVVGPS